MGDTATRADRAHARKLERVTRDLYATRCRLDYLSVLGLMDKRSR